MNARDAQERPKPDGRLTQLQQRALAALDRHDNAANTPADAVQLVESLNIHRAELELQNEALQAAQIEAEQARRRYQILFEQMPMPCLVLDANGMIEDSNDHAVRLLGAPRRFVTLDRRLWRCLGSKDTVRLHRVLRSLAPGASLVLHDMQLTEDTQDDDPGRVFDFHLVSLSHDYRLDRRVLLLMADRSAEAARQDAQQLYTQLLDACENPIHATNRRGELLWANRAQRRHWADTTAEAHHRCRNGVPPSEQARAQDENDRLVLQRGQAVAVHKTTRAPDGRPCHWLTYKFPLYDRHGQLMGVGDVSSNVTEQRQQLLERQLGKILFQHSPQAVLVTDADGQLLHVNPAFSRQSGYPPEAVIGRNPRLLRSGRHDPAFYRALWTALNRSGCWSGQFANRRADGTIYRVACWIEVLRDDHSQILGYLALQSLVPNDATPDLADQPWLDARGHGPGRALFLDRLTQHLALAERSAQPLTLAQWCLVAHDDRAEIDTTPGAPRTQHDWAAHWAAELRPGDTLALVDESTFAALLPQTDAQRAGAMVQSLLGQTPPGPTAAPPRPLRARLGLAGYPQDGTDPETLMHKAHHRMAEAPVQPQSPIKTP
ncbi:MAG: hypothetical protein OHK0048_18850 [Rhodoferax sp.]